MSKLQRFVRAAEVCEVCGGVNTFRKYASTKTCNGSRVDYLRCKVCGQLATRVTRRESDVK